MKGKNAMQIYSRHKQYHCHHISQLLYAVSNQKKCKWCKIFHDIAICNQKWIHFHTPYISYAHTWVRESLNHANTMWFGSHFIRKCIHSKLNQFRMSGSSLLLLHRFFFNQQFIRLSTFSRFVFWNPFHAFAAFLCWDWNYIISRVQRPDFLS